MINRFLFAIAVSIIILPTLGTLGCSQSNDDLDDLADAIDSLSDRINHFELKSSNLHSHEGLEGSADKITIEYLDGKTVTMTAGEDDYARFQSFYIYTQPEYLIIHLSEPGEARNSTKARELIPFSTIRSVKRLGESH